MRRLTRLALLLAVSCGVAGGSSVSVEATSEVLTEDLLDCAEVFSEIAANGFYVSKDNILYVTDGNTNQIYEYDGKQLSLLAGNANQIDGKSEGGYIDGKAEYTLFDEPFMAVPWKDGVIVSDTNNNMLRYIENGKVSTYAGRQEGGYEDGQGDRCLFYRPSGLAVDDVGNLYVADTGNGVIRKVDASGVVSTYVEGLHGPKGLCFYEGSLYVTDIESNQILSITEGIVKVEAGIGTQVEDEWIGGYVDGTVEEAQFSLPLGIYVDDSGIYVGDSGNHVIRTIVDGAVYTSLSDEGVVEPSAVVMYEGQLLVGDPFAKKISETGLTTSAVTEIIKSVQAVEKQGDLEVAEVLGESTEETVENGTNSAWLIGLVLAVCGVIVIMVFVQYRRKKNL